MKLTNRFRKILQKEEKPTKKLNTRHGIRYIFNLYWFLGLAAMPKTNKIAFAIRSFVINGLVAVYLPLAMTLTYIFERNTLQISDLLTSLQVAFNIYGMTFKIAALACYINQLRTADVLMDKLDSRCQAEDEMAEIRKIIKLGNRIVILFFATYLPYSSGTFLTSFIMGHPAYSIYIPLINWRDSRKEFYIAAFGEWVLMTGASCLEVATDCYPVIYISILRTHLEILKMRIKKLGSDPTWSKEENFRELVACIQDHKNIILLYDSIYPVISMTIFIQFVFMGAILSTTLINVLLIADFVTIVSSSVYLFAVLNQSLPCCYISNCLMDESDELGHIIFHSNWIHQDAKFRKLLVFFIQRSQKTITFTAGKMFPITLASFLTIAKFSFSLYTLLSQSFNRN